MDILEIPLNNIALGLTGFAVGIAFALRGLIEHIIGGFVLLIERPVRAGDRVTIDVFEGEITKIGMRSVTLRTWDYMEVIVPNADLVNKSITNWTFADYIVRTVVPVRVAYQQSPEIVQSILLATLQNSEYVVENPEPEVFLDIFSEYSMVFNVRYYIDLRKYSSRPRTKSLVMLELWNALKDNGISMPYPRQDIFLHNEEQNTNKKILLDNTENSKELPPQDNKD